MKDKFLPRISLLVALVIAISIAVGGQHTQTQIAPSVERLRTHIEHLASDKLEGRRTGGPGANLAAEYIANEFARYGLRRSIGVDRPGMSRLEADSPRRYQQRFPYVAGVELGKNNALRLIPQNTIPPKGLAGTITEPIDFRVGQDWVPLGFSSSQRVELAPLTFVHYGITAAELNYDDYRDTRIRGSIVIALSGTPDGDNPHGQFARYEDLRWKAIAARNAGAKALLVIAREQNLKDDRLASRLMYDNSAGDAGLPVAVISRQMAERILLAGGDQVGLASQEEFLRKSIAKNVEFGPPGNPNKSPGPKLLEWPVITLQTNVVRREVAASNVIGILDGSDPTLKNEAIVIGAHYDHLGHGGSGSLAQKEGEVHHGADDNASGVAGVLELARMFSSQRPGPRRTIVFIAFSGEEEGLLGSSYYVNHPVVPLANTVAMINMDMIGRMKNKSLIVGGVGTAQEWRSMIEAANSWQGMTVSATGASQENGSASAIGVPIVVAANGRTIVSNDAARRFQLTLNEDGFGPSDHSSFYAKQIPVLFFWTGTHEDYHKPTDTADKINYEDEARILALVAHITRNVDASDKRPVYSLAKTQATGRSTGFRVFLGTIPNYADTNGGLLLDGVRDDSPAAKAGLKAGDRIVKMAGRDVRNVYDYTYALGEMKAGEEYEVEILRGTERLNLKITPATRR